MANAKLHENTRLTFSNCTVTKCEFKIMPNKRKNSVDILAILIE